MADDEKTYVEWNQLNDVGEDLVNYAEKDIADQIAKTRELRNQITWEGEDADEVLKGYDEFMEEMEKVTEGVKNYGKFLSSVSESYKNTSNNIRDTFKNEVFQKKGSE